MFLWKKYFSKKEQLGLLIILLIGFSLRLLSAFFDQLQLEEVFSFFTTKENDFFGLLFQQHGDTAHPPLYYIFLHFWQKLGVSPFFLRLPSLIISIFTLFLIPLLAKKIYPNSVLLPFLFLFFYSFSNSQIYLNMEARPYSIAILLMLISMILFFDFLNTKRMELKSKKIFSYIFSFSLVNFLLLFSDYSGVWLLISYVIYSVFYFLFLDGNFIKKIAILNSLLFTAIFCSIWLPILIMNFSNSLSLELYLKPMFETGNIFYPLLQNLYFFVGIPYFYINNLYLNLIIFFLGLGGTIILAFHNLKKGLLIIFMIVFPLLISYIFSFMVSPIFLGRNLLLVNIMVSFGISYLLSSFFNKRKFILAISVFFWIILSLKHFPAIHFISFPYDHDWKRIAEVVSPYSKQIFFTQDYEWRFDPIKYYIFLNRKDYRDYYLFRDLDNLKDFLIQENISKKIPVFFIKQIESEDNLKKKDYYQKLAKEMNCYLEDEFDLESIYFVECVRQYD